MQIRNILLVREHLLGAAAVCFLAGFYHFFADMRIAAPAAGTIYAIVLLGLRSIYGTYKIARVALFVIFALIVAVNLLALLVQFSNSIPLTIDFFAFLYVGLMFGAVLWALE